MMDDELIARRLQLPPEPGARPGGPRQTAGPDATEPAQPAEQPPTGPLGREDAPWDTPVSDRWPSSDLQQLTLEDVPALPHYEPTESKPAPTGEQATTEASVDEVPEEPWFMQSEYEPWPGEETPTAAWDRPTDEVEATDSVVADRPSWDRPADDDSIDAESATETVEAMPEFEAVLARVAEQDPLASDPYDASAPVVADVGAPSRPVWPGWETRAGSSQTTDERSKEAEAGTEAPFGTEAPAEREAPAETEAAAETHVGAEADAGEPVTAASEMMPDDAAAAEQHTISPTPPVTDMETPAGPTPPDDLFDFPVAHSREDAEPEQEVLSGRDEAPASAEPVADTPAMAQSVPEVTDMDQADSAAQPDKFANWVLRIELAIEGNRLVPVEVTLRTPREESHGDATQSAEGAAASSESESATASASTTLAPSPGGDESPLSETESPSPEEAEERSFSDEPPFVSPPDEGADDPAMTIEAPPAEGALSVEAPLSAEAPSVAEVPLPEDPALSWASEEWPPRPFDPAAPAWPPNVQEPPFVSDAPSWPPLAEQPDSGSDQSASTTDAPAGKAEWPPEERLADPHAGFEPIADPLAEIPAPPPVNPDEPAASSADDTLRQEWRADHKPDLRAADSPAAEATHETSSIMTAGVTLGVGLVVVVLLVVFVQLMTSLLP